MKMDECEDCKTNIKPKNVWGSELKTFPKISYEEVDAFDLNPFQRS